MSADADRRESPFDRLCADALADEVAALVRCGVLDSRSPAADALLDYRNPPSSPRADRIAQLTAELAEARKVADEVSDVGAEKDRSYYRVCKERDAAQAEAARLQRIENCAPSWETFPCGKCLCCVRAEAAEAKDHVEELIREIHDVRDEMSSPAARVPLLEAVADAARDDQKNNSRGWDRADSGERVQEALATLDEKGTTDGK